MYIIHTCVCVCVYKLQYSLCTLVVRVVGRCNRTFSYDNALIHPAVDLSVCLSAKRERDYIVLYISIVLYIYIFNALVSVLRWMDQRQLLGAPPSILHLHSFHSQINKVRGTTVAKHVVQFAEEIDADFVASGADGMTVGVGG